MNNCCDIDDYLFTDSGDAGACKISIFNETQITLTIAMNSALVYHFYDWVYTAIKKHIVLKVIYIHFEPSFFPIIEHKTGTNEDMNCIGFVTSVFCHVY